MKKNKVLLNFGRTRSYLDPVRFLTSGSSGRMGLALYNELIKKGYQVTAVVGDCDLNIDIPCEKVFTNEEMLATMKKYFATADIIITCAALNDYVFTHPYQHKLSKANNPTLTVELSAGIDVIAELGKQKTNQYLVGFSAQDDDQDLVIAKNKLLKKNLDLIIVNNHKYMGQDNNEIKVINQKQKIILSAQGSKAILANKIIETIEKELR